MKLACLFSGGKDSNYALTLAAKNHDIVCLATIESEEKNSYMFQSAGFDCISYQAKALEIPLHIIATKGEKESELDDLYQGLKEIKLSYGIEGIVTGAIKSVYQATRIQRICDELEIWCFNPLWLLNEEKFLNTLVDEKFEVIIVGIFSYPFTSSMLGKTINSSFISEMKHLRDSYSISLAGEGGEFESIVIDGPLYKKKLDISFGKPLMDSENSGVLPVESVKLIEK